MAISLAFVPIFVYGSELFPTAVRSKTIGLAASFGRGTGMLTTWLNTGLIQLGVNPILFFGLLGLLMLVVLKWLPETSGCKLADEIPTEESKQEENELSNNTIEA